MATSQDHRIDGFGGRLVGRPESGWPDEIEGASGPFRFAPEAVAVPSSTDDVQALVRWANNEGRSLTPRGAGTGMPGGNISRDVLVDLRTGFRSILSVDPNKREITVEPGVTITEVETAAAQHGLTFPVQPSSMDRCVVGGLVANNAAGTRSFLYGAARKWIRAATVVLADGTKTRLRAPEETSGGGTPADPLLDAVGTALQPHAGSDALWKDWPGVRKNSSGYAVDTVKKSGSGLDLLVGSEGTLGLATEVTLRLADSAESSATLLVATEDLSGVSKWAEHARSVEASACEFIGQRLIEMAKLDKDVELASIVRGAAALVLVELEGPASVVDARLRMLEAAAAKDREPTRIARSTEEMAFLWGLRKRASPAIRDAAAAGLRSMQFIEDSVVPPARLEEYLSGVLAILARAGTDAAMFGHAGDANVHVNPLVDLRRPDWSARVRSILEETVDLVAGLGGTLAGEHGDGRVRAPFLERIWGLERAEVFRSLKAHLDPNAVLNPGVIVPLPGQDPLDGLSYLERSAR